MKTRFINESVGPQDEYARAHPPQQKYAAAGIDPSGGVYFPDNIIDPFVKQAQEAMPLLKRAGPPPSPDTIGTQLRFTLQEARDIVLAAFNDFDPALGKAAKEVFDAGFDKAAANSQSAHLKIDWDKPLENGSSPNRWRLEEVEVGKVRMQRSVPAGVPANPNSHSVIDYQFDGTMNSLVYLAHEVGHSIADDYLQKGGKFKAADLPQHMAETQAYFVQNVLYGFLMTHPELNAQHNGITQAAKQHFSDTMAANLHHFPIALNAMEARDGAGTSTMQNWLGTDWKKFRETAEVESLIAAKAAGGNEATEADKKLESKVERLHIRPMGILTALGAYLEAKDQPPEGRQQITNDVMSKNGPKGMGEILAAAGIKTESELAGFAQRTVKQATSLLKQPSAPKPSVAAPI